MSQKTGDVRAISRIAGILAEFELADRQAIIAFTTEHVDLVGAKAAVRVSAILAELDEAARRRVVGFFQSQLEPAAE